MEQSFVACIQQTVRVLAENYEFDYEDALALVGLDDLIVTTNLGKTKKVESTGDAPKRTKPKFPLPFTGEIIDDCCRAIVFNSGLFTQCLKAPIPNSQKSLCQTCHKQAEKEPTGSPPLGFIDDRVDRGDDWTDPKGRRPVPYTKVMKAKKFTREDVIAQVSNDNMSIDVTIFDEADSEKRGRKKGGKKTEVVSIFGDDEDDGMLGALIQGVKDSESESSETSKTSKTSSKKSKEEREAEKQEKASQKSENDMMKAEEKRMKDFKKEQDKITKETEKKMKEQQKEAIKALKEAKDEEKRLAKEAKEAAKAEKEAEKAKKEAAKAKKESAKSDEKRSPIKDLKEEKSTFEEEVVPPLGQLDEVDEVEEVEVEEVEVEEVEDGPGTPLAPPPLEEPASPLAPPPMEEIMETVVEDEPVIAVKTVETKKPKKKFAGKFKGQDGISYVYDDNRIVYKKDSPTVRVGILTDDGFEMDDEEEEEEEEELSEVE